MANQKISELPVSGVLTGTEMVPIVQAGNTVRTTIAGLQGTTTAVINPKLAPFFAAGDGVTDDTAALQAAINACIGAGDPTVVGRATLHSLYLPIGTYKVTAPLVIRGVRGFNMVGESMFNTVISHAGTFAQVLHLDGVAYSTFSNFRIGGISGSVTNGINIEKGTGTALGVTRNTFSNICVLSDVTYVSAVALGISATLAVDENLFVSCVFGGNNISHLTNWQYGVRCGSGGAGNVLGNVFFKCNFNNLVNAVSFQGTSGAVVSCGFQNNHTDINNTLVNRNCLVSNCRSEGGIRFYVLGSGTGSGGCMDTVIDNCEINGANYVTGDSDYWLDYRAAGNLHIRNTTLVGVPGGVTTKVYTVTQSSSRLNVIVDGLSSKGPSTDAIVTGVATPGVVMILMNAYTEIDQASGAAISSYTAHHLQQSGGNFSGPKVVDAPALVDPVVTGNLNMGNVGNSNYIQPPFNDGIAIYTSGALLMHFKQNGTIIVNDAHDLVFGTGTGTKIGTGSTQKIGFYGATPIARPAANPDTSGATLVDLETEVNQLKAILRSLGLLTP